MEIPSAPRRAGWTFYPSPGEKPPKKKRPRVQNPARKTEKGQQREAAILRGEWHEGGGCGAPPHAPAGDIVPCTPLLGLRPKGYKVWWVISALALSSHLGLRPKPRARGLGCSLFLLEAKLRRNAILSKFRLRPLLHPRRRRKVAARVEIVWAGTVIFHPSECSNNHGRSIMLSQRGSRGLAP